MMYKMTIYRVRFDGVFDGEEEIQVESIEKSGIPSGYTRTSPHPIPEGHYAIMRGGWQYCVGTKPEVLTVEVTQPSVSKEQLLAQLQALQAQINALA